MQVLWLVVMLIGFVVMLLVIMVVLFLQNRASDKNQPVVWSAGAPANAESTWKYSLLSTAACDPRPSLPTIVVF